MVSRITGHKDYWLHVALKQHFLRKIVRMVLYNHNHFKFMDTPCPININLPCLIELSYVTEIVHQVSWPRLVQVMACRLLGARLFPEPMLTQLDHNILKSWNIDLWEQLSVKFEWRHQTFFARKSIWKCSLRNDAHVVLHFVLLLINSAEYEFSQKLRWINSRNIS